MYLILVLVMMVFIVATEIVNLIRSNINEKKDIKNLYSDEELDYLATRATVIAIAKKMEEMSND